ncbi:MAG: type 2 lanthipeptide synthetase LanM [Lachnospiraceae bacterium]|nr:type 2 lanthipeptide synthetase LanM [Lachnospiraceae bacterium]
MGKKQNDNYMFKGFFKPYLEKVKKNIFHTLKSQSQQIDIEYCKRLIDDIYSNLFKLTVRALIRELHIYKGKGLLKGKTKEVRFTYFEMLCEKKEFKDAFFQKYPQLEHMIDDYVSCLSENLIKIIIDTIADKPQLEESLGVKVDHIKDISIGKGDTHNGGKTVAIIYFKTCKIVYKPHTLKADVIFAEMVKWINMEANLQQPLKIVKTLSMNDRGWQECIEHLPCKSDSESHSYYYKMGCLLALFYALGTTDLHFENVIACRDNPMIIDLETILTNNRVDKLNTVLDTGLLPQVTSDFLIDVDISGICGKSNKSEKMKMMVVINRKTDEMMVDEIPAIVADRQNLVHVNGKPIRINDYANDLINGYQTVTEFLINNKVQFLRKLDTLISRNDMFRTVLRHTQVYSKYLSAALHPDYLVNSEKRLELFQRLMSNCKNEHEFLRVKDEITTLMTGDVPYYMFDYYSRNLYSGNSLVSRDYFAHSAREICIERMNYLEKYKIPNIRLIQKSLFTAYINDPESENNVVYNYCRKSSNYEDTIKYADNIMDSIFCLDNQEENIFFINSLYNNQVSLETINSNMYEGGGLIYYLAAIGKVYNREKYSHAADKLLMTATELLKYRSREEKFEFVLSAFSGYGSLIYLNYLLYYLTNKMCYKESADDIINDVLEQEQWENIKKSCKFDYLGGLAGVIVFMAHILLHEENAQVRCMCMKAVELLNDYISNNEVNQIGLAHGLSGFAYAFTMMYRITDEEYYFEMAKQLLMREDTLYESKSIEKVSWCKGETGMCIARLKYLEVHPCQELLDKFIVYYSVLTSKGLTQVRNACLCHGIYGNIEVIRRINQANILNDDAKNNSLNLEDLEHSLFEKQNDLYLGFCKDFETDIFMTGLSGIFYSILKEEEKALPSILFLEV